ncbi:MprA protease, GlyGly-CTERM protein-sorting domain-containing form [Luteolibacter arcticus]|uniref:MprA protease, GlyGly-CTERM protein-sorting domain-containing form n=1 Tax=Luteolibacter arcticus TaxID=1581411 RepID=A0ABT3GPE3_9BACT|nr:MprA protease, GlyGly-CTERM protein-sorting domain-containing form [Luteolibacter arcticus]MCW1925388.1 MprA protease, GlyGly-CTERM protein-sorting domain-containing form [Luteolibacter arcticus]
MKFLPCLVAGIGIACPAGAVVLNMTNVTIAGETPDTLGSGGATFRGGFINGALFRDPSVDGSAGSGVFRDLYRLSPAGKDSVEQGYNRPGIMNTSVPNGFDPYLKFGELVQDASQSSYIFVIDINESNNATDRYLSLDDLKIWIGGTTDPNPLPSSLSATMTALGVPEFDMNPSGQQNFVMLDATLSSGSGGGDVFVFVPKSFFPQNTAPNANIFIYTRMGGYTGAAGFGAGATQEQVSIPGKSIIGGTATTVSTIQSGVATIPEPSTFAALLFAGLLGFRRRRD